MSGLFMGSEMRSRNALPQREQQVSNKEALTDSMGQEGYNTAA